MTDKTEDAPGETGQDLNDPQPNIYDAPGQTVAYAIYHPDHGFAETPHSAIEDFTDSRDDGSAILLYRQRDVAAADRLQRNWSREAIIIPVGIPKPGQETVGTDLAPLYVIRRKSDGQVQANEINSEPEIMQVHCFASFDEAAAARLLFSKPEDEIVPLIELTAATSQLANENAYLKQELADRDRQLAKTIDVFKQYREREIEQADPKQSRPSDADLNRACTAAAAACEDELRRQLGEPQEQPTAELEPVRRRPDGGRLR